MNQCCTRGTVLCHSNALGRCNAVGQQVTARLRCWTDACFNYFSIDQLDQRFIRLAAAAVRRRSGYSTSNYVNHIHPLRSLKTFNWSNILARWESWIYLLHCYHKCSMSEEAWKSTAILPRNVSHPPQLIRLWSVMSPVLFLYAGWGVLAQIASPHLVHASVSFLECVTRVDRCLLPSTRTGTDPSRSEWQVEDFVRRLGDKLHSSSCNVTEDENICPQDSWVEFLSARLALFAVLLWPAVVSDEVLSALSVYQHRSESLRRAWNWPAASGIYVHS